MHLYGEIIPEIIHRSGVQTVLYLACTMVSSVDLAHNRVSRAKELGICGLWYKIRCILPFSQCNFCFTAHSLVLTSVCNCLAYVQREAVYTDYLYKGDNTQLSPLK